MSVSKIVLLCVSFVVLRAALPRMRFDQLTLLCWKYCFPLAFVLILWEASAFVFWLNADLSLAGSGETFFEELLSHSLPVVPFFGDKTRKTAFPAMVRPSPSDKEDSLVFMDSLMVSSNTSEPMKVK